MNVSPEYELTAYEALVDRLAAAGTGEVYANTGMGHARIVVRKLLSVAQRKVAVYSGNLSGEVHNIEAYRQLIERVGAQNIRVVLSEPEKANDELVKYLQDSGVDVRIYPEIGAHFVVADEHAFRMEHDLEKMKALFAFGGEQPRSLLSSFDRIWNASDKFSIREYA